MAKIINSENIVEHLQEQFAGLPANTVLVPPDDDSDVKDMEFNDASQMYGPEDYCKVCNAAPCNAEQHYWGVCPVCHKTDGFLNAGKTHIFICREHKTRWIVGANLFSSWRDETEEEQRALYDRVGVGEFEEVVPHCSPSWIGPSRCGEVFTVHKFSFPPERADDTDAAESVEFNTFDLMKVSRGEAPEKKLGVEHETEERLADAEEHEQIVEDSSVDADITEMTDEELADSLDKPGTLTETFISSDGPVTVRGDIEDYTDSHERAAAAVEHQETCPECGCGSYFDESNFIICDFCGAERRQ
jgi:hypothetical protein